MTPRATEKAQAFADALREAIAGARDEQRRLRAGDITASIGKALDRLAFQAGEAVDAFEALIQKTDEESYQRGFQARGAEGAIAHPRDHEGHTEALSLARKEGFQAGRDRGFEVAPQARAQEKRETAVQRTLSLNLSQAQSFSFEDVARGLRYTLTVEALDGAKAPRRT
jgi:hypothetical protein